MDRSGSQETDDASVTLRVPRSFVALAVALITHAGVVALVMSLPEPKVKEERIELTVQRSNPPPPQASASPPPAAMPPTPPKKRTTRTPPQTSPVVPELPPSDDPPENRAQLPVVEESEIPAPPPAPSTWGEKLLASLAIKAPRDPSGVLAPSLATLDRVALNDARMHDDDNERRIQEDHGPFFRRGIEALRRTWHPDRVLRSMDRDPTRLCGREARTTFAVAVIDRQGDVVDVEVRGESGCAPLDDEAVAAFKRVAQFPFPPEGLFVLPDGTPSDTARYPVRFIVTFDGGMRLEWN